MHFHSLQSRPAGPRPSAGCARPAGEGPPRSLQRGARVWHVPLEEAPLRVRGPPGHAPPRTGGRVWGPIPRGTSPPPPCKMAAAAAHVTGAPAPPLGGRAEAGPRLPGAPLGLRGLGRPGRGAEWRTTWTLCSEQGKGKFVWQPFIAPEVTFQTRV